MRELYSSSTPGPVLKIEDSVKLEHRGPIAYKCNQVPTSSIRYNRVFSGIRVRIELGECVSIK